MSGSPKGKEASLTLRGFDLLNRDSNFQRISETNYLMQRASNTIGRYVMLTFSLRIKKIVSTELDPIDDYA